MAESLDLPGLTLVRTEHPVESFSADIVCKVVDSDHFVLIENQLDKSDHIHVGQILTYAAKFDARAIIWIAAKFTEAHRAALDWLNRISSEDYGFFGVEVEAVVIGSSAPAPLFNVVSKSNDWTKPTAEPASADSELSEFHQDNIAFWSELDDTLENECVVTRRARREVKGSNVWIPLANDSSAYVVAYRALSGVPSVGVYVGLYGADLDLVQRIYDERIQAAGESWATVKTWVSNKKDSVRHLSIGKIPTDGKERSEQIRWLADQIDRTARVLAAPELQRQPCQPKT